MLYEIYLSAACCEELGLLYREQTDPVTLCPARLLSLRDWDAQHQRTLKTFILADRQMELMPVIDQGPSGYTHPGWYAVMNPPETRFFVTADIDIGLLEYQRDLLESLCENIPEGRVYLTEVQEKKLRGVVRLLTQMMEDAQDQQKK